MVCAGLWNGPDGVPVPGPAGSGPVPVAGVFTGIAARTCVSQFCLRVSLAPFLVRYTELALLVLRVDRYMLACVVCVQVVRSCC